MTNIFNDKYPASGGVRYFGPKVAGLLIGLFLLSQACDNDSDQESVPPTPIESTVFDGTVTVDGMGDWDLQCTGQQYVSLYSGQTFSEIVGTNVDVYNPAGIGQQNLPHMAVVEASAEVAGVPDPAVVQPGSYSVPMYCEPNVTP